ncbi:pentapeptide repeat-containing protein [Rhizohabitans arisaemae]|uniref:pentapeptide repeat-containing protein n=1 Tax=Rhizohabitans arisaemae TaxID=2720610 RepID=UPI0024B0ED95|nr:pentapeptide repeat-containing protein [Rhizohabitans arisaemae]
MRLRSALMLSIVTAISAIPLWLAPAQAACKSGSGPDYRGRNLTRVENLPRDLSCANFTGAKLDGVDLSQYRLERAVFKDASLKEVEMGQAQLNYADFRGADLSDADLLQAKLEHADLSGADLTRATVTQAELDDAKLVGATLHDAELGQVDARRADFTRATLTRTDLSQGTLLNAVFTDANLTGADLTQAKLKGAGFTGADLTGASLIQAQDADFTGSKGVDGEEPPVPDEPEPDPEDTGKPVAAEESAVGRKERPTGVLLVIVAAAVLGVVLLTWAGYRRRRSVADRKRQLVAADLVQLGEEIDTLDFDVRFRFGDDEDYRYAVDAYTAARSAMDSGDLAVAAEAVQHARYALERVRFKSS